MVEEKVKCHTIVPYYLYKQCCSKATPLLPVCCVLAVFPGATQAALSEFTYTQTILLKVMRWLCSAACDILPLVFCPAWTAAITVTPGPLATLVHISVYSQRLAYNSINCFLLPTVRGLFTALGGS